METYLRRFVAWFISLSIIFGLAGLFLVIGILIYYGKDLPDYEQLKDYQPPTMTRFYAHDGQLLAEYAKEQRLFVPMHAIPKRLSQAFIAAEDKNFYKHPGIDVSSILRAAIANISNIRANRPLVGGSTITQQVVKNFLLTNEQSLKRKIKEAILSFRITQYLSKDRILELYLNKIYLGSRSYGVAAAALNYFNKSVGELKIEEVALLAAMPKAPSTFNPRKNYKRAKLRRDWVLKRMYDEGFISKDEMMEALATDIVLQTRDRTKWVKADFFAEEVRRKLIDVYGEKTLYEGGLLVRTTIDPTYQEMARRSLKWGLSRFDRRFGYRGPLARGSTKDWQKTLGQFDFDQAIDPWRQAIVLQRGNKQATIGFSDGTTAYVRLRDSRWIGRLGKLRIGDIIAVDQIEDTEFYRVQQIPRVNGGIVVMDPHTGRVLAMEGGFSYDGSQFNRVTQAKRQPGSAFKPFVYLTALDNGFTPASIIVDAPIELEQGPGLPLWRPKNYSGDFYGPTTLRKGLEKSRNVMTVRLAQMIGLEPIVNTVERLGIANVVRANYAMVLGAMETDLLSLTNAYATLVGGGKKLIPSFIERIQDASGSTIYRRDARGCYHCMVLDESAIDLSPPKVADTRPTIVDPRTAYQMVSILEGVIQRGTGVRARRLGRVLGGKTGTTNDSKDTWFIGFTADLVVGVFVGYDRPRSLNGTGSSIALPIFIDFMAKALKDTPDIPFRIPPGIKLIKIDKESGMLAGTYTAPGSMIYEAFKVGTEPTFYGNQDHFERLGEDEIHPETIGTGGFY